MENRKLKKFKKSLMGIVASACDIDENELLYHNSQNIPNALTQIDYQNY